MSAQLSQEVARLSYIIKMERKKHSYVTSVLIFILVINILILTICLGELNDSRESNKNCQQELYLELMPHMSKDGPTVTYGKHDY